MPEDANEVLNVLDKDTLQPSNINVQKVNRNAVLPQLASMYIYPVLPVGQRASLCDHLPMRLIQMQPDWALHFMLRFRGLAYRCENSRLPHSLGHMLPILINGHYIWNTEYALEQLQNVSSRSRMSVSLLPGDGKISDHKLRGWITSEIIVPLKKLRQLKGDDWCEITAAVGGAFSPYGIYLFWRNLALRGQNFLLSVFKSIPLPARLKELLTSHSAVGTRNFEQRTLPTLIPQVPLAKTETESESLLCTPKPERPALDAIEAYIEGNESQTVPGSALSAAKIHAENEDVGTRRFAYETADCETPLAVRDSKDRVAITPLPFPALGPESEPDGASKDDASSLVEQLVNAFKELDAILQYYDGKLPISSRLSATEAELCGALVTIAACPAGRAAVDLGQYDFVNKYVKDMCRLWFCTPIGDARTFTLWTQATLQLLDSPCLQGVGGEDVRHWMKPSADILHGDSTSELLDIAEPDISELDIIPASVCSVQFKPLSAHSPLMRLYRWIRNLPEPPAEPVAPAGLWVSEISPFGLVTLTTTVTSFACYIAMSRGWSGVPTRLRLPEFHFSMPTFGKKAP